jgi:hypothetical protein
MGFGAKKKVAEIANQETIETVAADALRKLRASSVQLAVRCTFTAPVMMKRWEEKAFAQMLGKQTGHDVPKQNKDLTQEYEASWYRNANGELAIPARIVKAALVRGAIAINDKSFVTGADVKRQVRVMGFTIPIFSKTGKPYTSARKDMTMDVRVVQNASGPDIRARSVIPAGSYMELAIRFSPTFGVDRIVASLESAGQLCGLCEMRPEKGGELGTWDIEALKSDAKNIERIAQLCGVPEEELKVPQRMLHALSEIPENKRTQSQKKALALAKHIGDQHAEANGAGA